MQKIGGEGYIWAGWRWPMRERGPWIRGKPFWRKVGVRVCRCNDVKSYESIMPAVFAEILRTRDDMLGSFNFASI